MISDQERKQLMLAILQEIDVFCRTNDICYFLGYGSLLGAVRHKGYIPWDDDIDVWMPRPDYMRFLECFSHPQLNAYSAEFTPGWDHYIAKVCDERTVINEGHGDTCGIYVDIFPLDGWPEDPAGRNAHFRAISRYLRLWSSLHYTQHMVVRQSNGLAKNMKILASKFVGLFCKSETPLKKLLDVLMKYPYETSTQVATLIDGYWAVPREAAEPLIEGEFEGCHFKIPAAFDTWLTALYGDYMQLPPVEQRVATHGTIAYWK